MSVSRLPFANHDIDKSFPIGRTNHALIDQITKLVSYDMTAHWKEEDSSLDGVPVDVQ